MDCNDCPHSRTFTPYGTPLRDGCVRCAHPVTEEARPLISADDDFPGVTARDALDILSVWWNTSAFRWPWEFRPSCLGHCAVRTAMRADAAGVSS